MRTLIFGRIVVLKERTNERRLYIFVEWLNANKRSKSMKTLISAQANGHAQTNNKWKKIVYIYRTVVCKRKK